MAQALRDHVRHHPTGIVVSGEVGIYLRRKPDTVRAADVQRAIEQRVYRSAQVQERLREMVVRGVLLVHPQGTAIGQVHGLAVMAAGDLAFGLPARITATSITAVASCSACSSSGTGAAGGQRLSKRSFRVFSIGG